MQILTRYLFRLLLQNVLLSLLVFTLLFLVIDFFERIDNLIAEDAGFSHMLSYFLLKVPQMVATMLPVAILVATLFTVGSLGKNSEITAMRASGIRMSYVLRPFVITGLALSIITLLLNETIVPSSMRRAKEIYNIDIRKKDVKGGYSQSDIWWRSGERYYSVGSFDSRTSSLHRVTVLEFDQKHRLQKRIVADSAQWVGPGLGWTMHGVTEYAFAEESSTPNVRPFKSLPLAINEAPMDFYEMNSDPETMSFRQFRRFIRKQQRHGLSITSYLPDLHHKIAFPFLSLILPFAALPFALTSARSGSLAIGFVAGLVLAFTYYAMHSMSLSLGRADILPPLAAAWSANLILICVGFVLNLGTEAPR
ncbi:MAG: LPS export ABC transporter permease LptG [Bdellovibrionota bacterium]|nr:MAG: LPS export ABC transporter permease LptG [Bdellovibrionota bacterium]